MGIGWFSTRLITPSPRKPRLSVVANAAMVAVSVATTAAVVARINGLVAAFRKPSLCNATAYQRSEIPSQTLIASPAFNEFTIRMTMGM